MSKEWEPRGDFDPEVLAEGEGIVLAGKAFEKILDCSSAENINYFNLVEEEPVVELEDCLVAALKVQSKYLNELSALDAAIEKYQGWLDNINSVDIVQRVFKKKFNLESLESTLLGLGAEYQSMAELTGGKLEDSEEVIDIETLQGGHYFVHNTVDFCNKLDVFDSNGGLNHLIRLSNMLGGVYAEGNRDVTKKFINDILKEIKESNEYYFPEIFPLVSVDTLAKWFLNSGGLVHPLIDRADYLIPTYVKLTDRHYSNILNNIPTADNRFELVELVVGILDKLEPANLRHVSKLLGGTPSNRRLELLEYIEHNPESCELYITLKKQSVSDNVFSNFLLTQSALQIKATKQSVLECIEETAESQPKAAALLLEQAPIFAFSPDASAILDIAKNYELGDIVLKDYFLALQAQEPNKAKLALQLGVHQPGSQELKQLRTKTGTIPDNELRWINDGLDYPTLKKRISRLTQREESQPRQVLRRKEITWLDLLTQSLESGGADSGTLRTVGGAYQILPESMHYRMRNVWKTQPNTIEDFCTDVQEFYRRLAFELILKSPRLFRGYKARINEDHDAFTTEFRELISSGTTNIYKDLINVLKLDIPDEPSPIPERVRSLEEMDFPTATYTRIVIMGSRYANKARNVLSASTIIPVKILGPFARKGDFEKLTPTDAFVWVSGGVFDPLYSLAKKHCRKHNIDFYHFKPTGIEPLQ